MEVEINRPGGKPRGKLPLWALLPGGFFVFFGLLLIYNPDKIHYILGGGFMLIGVFLTLMLLGIRRLIRSKGLMPPGMGGGSPFGGQNPFGGGQNPFGGGPNPFGG